MSNSPSRRLKGRRLSDKGSFDMALESKLINAAESGNSALVKRLIKKGADIHYVENRELGYNALHYAAFNGYYDVVEDLLLAGADVNRITTDHYSPLMLAALGGFTDVAENMFRIAKPDLTIRTTDSNEVQDGLTCLHLAVVSGSDAAVRLLIAQGAEREAVTNAGYTALHLAAEAGLPHIVATLLSAAPSLYGSGSHQALRFTAQGRTALHLAVLSGVRDSVQLLLADDPAEANIPDADGYTPLHLAVLHQFRDIADLLLRQGVAVDTRAAAEGLEGGRTPLLDAVANRDAKTVDKLLQYSADPTAADQSGATPLLLAAGHSSERIVRSLLDTLASSATTATRRQALHAQDQAGDTALHLAVEAGHPGVVKRLLDAGVSAAIPNKVGVTAADLADQLGNRKLQALLRREVRPAPDPASDHSPVPSQEAEAETSSPEFLEPAPAGSSGQSESPVEAATRDSSASPLETPSTGAAEAETVSVRLDGEGTEWTCRTRRAAGSDASWEEVMSCTTGADGQVVEALVTYAEESGAAPLPVPAGEQPGLAQGIGEEGEASFSAGSHLSSLDTDSQCSASPRRRGKRGGHHWDDRNRAAKAEKVRQLRRDRRQERRRKRAAPEDPLSGPEVGECSPQAGPKGTFSGTDGLEQPPVREQAEAALYHLRAQYEQRLLEVSERYEARIAALQAQLRDLHGMATQEPHQSPTRNQPSPGEPAGELNSSLDWDQEIEFSPGSPRSPRRSPRSGRKHRKRLHCSPQAAVALGGATAEGASPDRNPADEATTTILAQSAERVDESEGAVRRCHHSRSQVQGRAAEGCEGAGTGPVVRGVGDQTCRATMPILSPRGTVLLTDFERFFLDALSIVLVLTAVALLLFIRFRLH